MRTAIAGMCLLASISLATTVSRAEDARRGPVQFVDSGLNLSAGSSCFAICLGDVDGDGDLDAFVAQYHTASRLWLSDGGGLYLPSSATFTGTSAHGAALEDLDGDEDLDLLLIFNEAQHRVYFNDGHGGFADSGQRLGAATDLATAVRVGDLDGDGDVDALVESYGVPNTIWLNDGTGHFGSSRPLASGISGAVAFGDLDGDRDLDVYIAGGNALDDTVWLNDGTGGSLTAGRGSAADQATAVSSWGISTRMATWTPS